MCTPKLEKCSAGAPTEQTCRNELPQTQVATRPTVHWVNRRQFLGKCTKQTPSINYLIDHLCELWVAKVKLEKPKQDLSRTMDINQEITTSWKNTSEKPKYKPRYKRTDNFGSWTKRENWMRKEQWKTNVKRTEALWVYHPSYKPYPRWPSVMYMFGYLLYFWLS